MNVSNLEHLSLLLGGFFSLLLLIAFLGLAYLLSYMRRERKKRLWRDFATANNFAFERGRFPGGASVVGEVDDRRLSLATPLPWRPLGLRTLTRMTLSTRAPATPPALQNQTNEAALPALVDLLATIYHHAFTRPALRDDYQEAQQRKPWPVEIIGNIVWISRACLHLLRGKSFLSLFLDDNDDNSSDLQVEALKQQGRLLEDVLQKLSETYDQDLSPLFEAAVRRRLAGSGFFKAGGTADLRLFLEDYQIALEKELKATFRGRIEFEDPGRRISYTQRGLETEIDYLQAVYELLVTLARAYPAALDIGMEITPFLKEAAIPANDLHPVVVRLIQDIAAETGRRFGKAPDRFLCRRCLTRCCAHVLDLPAGQPVVYYGCRVCRQSRSFFEGQAIVVLDRQGPTGPVQENGALRINWFADRGLFDFDAVEIIDAGDEAVERFAVRVGNDTDAVRRPGYKKMTCAISPACDLSQNTLRILERMFGQVTLRHR